MAADVAATPTPSEDTELMRRVQAGDEEAFAALMQRWELPVKAVIARVVLNAGEAAELAQETFVRVWQQRDKFQVGAEFRPWIFAIAINLARNRLRWWRRRPVVSLEAWSEGPGRPGGGGAGEWRGRTDPEHEDESRGGAVSMERAERAAAVRDAIAQLPLELREAIVLFEYEQMSQAEIAAAVGATTKAVEMRIQRARQKLRAALKDRL